MAPVLLLLLMISLPHPDLSAASVTSSYYFPKEEDPSSGVIIDVHVDKQVDTHDVNSGSFSEGDAISGSNSGSSGYDGVEREFIPSGEPSPYLKGSGAPGFDEKQHISGDAVTEFPREHSGRESTTPVELLVEAVSGDYLATRTPDEKKRMARGVQESETNEYESTQETLGAKNAASSTWTTRHRVSSSDTAGDYSVSVQINTFTEKSEVTSASYHSDESGNELVTDVTSEGEGPLTTIPDKQILNPSSDRISTVSVKILTSTHESSGTSLFPESETVGQETAEKLSYERTEITNTIQNENTYTSTSVSELTYTTRTTLSTSTPGMTYVYSENKTTEDVNITSDTTETISIATKGENKLPYFSTNYDTKDSRSRTFETTQEPSEEDATLSHDHLTTRDETFATANNEKPLEHTLTDFTKFTKETSDFGNWSSSRTHRETRSTGADRHVTTTSDPDYITPIVTSDTSRVVSSPGGEGSAATTTTYRERTQASTEPATNDSDPPETMNVKTETTTKAPTTTATKPTTTTTRIAKTTTTAKPQKLGDSCVPGEVCGNIADSGCINNTCACKENYFKNSTDSCLREPYNLTLKEEETCLVVYWQGNNELHDVRITFFDDSSKNKKTRNPGQTKTCDLQPGSMVQVSVQSIYGGDGVSANITMKPSVPTPVQNESNNTCIRVTWSQGPGYVDEYLVTLTGTEVQYMNRTVSKQWTECDLVPGTRYVFSVQAVRNSMPSYRKDLPVLTSPSTPINASSKPGSNPSSCVNISWWAGEGHAEQFFINQKGGEGFPNVTVTFKTLSKAYSKEVCKLGSGRRYNVTVESAAGGNLSSSPAQVTACTAPSPVRQSSVKEKDASSVTLQWKHPADGEVEGYILHVVGENRNQTEYINATGLTENRFAARNLKPGTQYNFSIASLFCGLTSDVTTLSETTNDSALTDLVVISNGTQLGISWKTPEELKQVGKFHIELTVLSAQSGITVISKNVTNSPQTVETNRSGECFEVRLTVGKGAPLDRFSSTDEAAPGSVRDLRAERLANNRRVLNVTWSAPNVTNGVIQKYDVTVIDQRDLVIANMTLICKGDCTVSCSGSGGGKLSKREASAMHFQRSETHFAVHMDQLSPYQNYDVSVVAYTSAGPGPSSNFAVTDQLPADVTNFKATAHNSSCIQLHWDYPENVNSTTVTHFAIQHIKVDRYEDLVMIENITLRRELVCGLEFWTEYEFKVTAFNQEGEGKIATRRVTTGEHTPDVVANLTASPESDIYKPRSITVQWLKPNRTYGTIQKYFIDVKDSSGNIVKSQEVIPRTNEAIVYCEKVQGLAAETNYIVQVFGATSAGNGSAAEKQTTIPAGVLSRPSEGVSVMPLLKGVEEGSSMVIIHLPISLLCVRDYGRPKEAGFIVGRAKWTLLEEPTTGTRPRVNESWRDVDHSSDTAAYFVHLDVERECSKANGSSIQVLVGSDTHCTDIQGSTTNTCNGRLQPETEYRFQAVYCTMAACTYSSASQVYRTDTAPVPESGSDTAGVAAGVSVTFLIIFLGSGAAFYFVRRHKRSRTQPDPEERPMEPEVSRNRPVKLTSFAQHVEQLHRDSNLGFSEEYKLLKDISREYTTRAADLPACKAKNRYTNILPWDHSRVKLLPTDDEEGSDYINANYLPGEKHRREFIAAQGPLPAIVDDFWRMVWENKVAVIVMLTQCVEKGKVKCEKYWPEEGESVYHGDLCVQVRSQSVLPDYIIRVIDITLGNHTRMIKHFHFMRWPDHGCPERPAMLLSFVSAVRAHMPHSGSGPTLVHCSAGVGRTGTFIALDQLLQQIRRQSEVDIFGLVLNMRDHRIHMVQTENQYIYIHDCLLDALSTDTDEEESEESEEEEEHIYGNC